MSDKVCTHSAPSYSRRAALGLLLGGAAGAAMAQSAGVPVVTSSPYPIARPKDLHKLSVPSGEALIKASKVSGAVSYAVADETGKILEAHGPVLRLPPASVAKVITAIYALEHLGGDFTFATDVFATGTLVNGVIQGDVILAGSGDPTLDTDRLGDLAGQLAAMGVTGITGKFYVFGAALPRIEHIDHQQTEYAGYNPTITGLNINYNRVHFEWKKRGDAFDLVMDARAKRFAPKVRIAQMKIAERGLPVFDHTAGVGRDDWTVSRSALGNGGARWLPVRLPALYAGEVFAAVARGQGVSLPNPERLEVLPANVMRLAQLQSIDLTKIVRDMLKYSTNLTAEVIGLAASRKRGLDPMDLSSSAQAMSAWAKDRLGTRHLDFVDHSGLGGASVVSTSDMVRLLSVKGIEPLLGPLLKPIAARDGDYKVITSPDIDIHAKTGTLDFVSTLAGYVTAPDGQRLTFAVFAADLPARRAAKAQGNEVPKGAKTFNARAKRLQQAMIRRWAVVYGS
ncbi:MULTISPECIES: D-alanyl-D-alanine carboxypeptidase/D-alanyl-D-alanine endopeptidase [Pacificibacter]|uniref:D-alanyl-D-alanine carboxypeptidase/D-alanyl-D-alanine endopeptidase n=1 Tax=Pacificibacter TaxID=1042323 RepID=UPI001C0916BF|nr:MULTISPECIES: D-alanyl-D-alanine carboxypeptidase/D-alanyl-D-alanine-endopeptidase [Pacificibacter]MBU2936522.1 D-alanyl-D-alanine carboxypeptidase/D-alanyl-D-alanine-endopeptidase [Pacificibacter marinus]MDO6614676.1 D-alanyl-D-alanine carboxypeptidase/D-alanyl-D-alanine-endopeptidase [Pacificibacter sp. 1_MG-2023]